MTPALHEHAPRTEEDTGPCPTAHNRSATWPSRATPAPARPSLFEALLHAGGAIQAAGTIERGSTVSDFDPIERERSHSIDAAIASIDHAPDGQSPIHINLIDTPGYPDFRGPTLSALAAVETVAVVVDADTGISHGTRRMMEHAKARNLCRVIVVNKIDHPGAKLGALLDESAQDLRPRGTAAEPAGRGRQAGRRLLLAVHWSPATWARSPTGTRRSSTRWSRSTKP